MHKEDSLNYIKYPGNKTKFTHKILSIIGDCASIDTFIEPFGGSGVLSLEVSKSHIPNIILNDIEPHVMAIHTAFKYGTYAELEEIIQEIWSYGDPSRIKNDYYTARTFMNKKYFEKSDIKTGFYYWTISTFAINSMMRFGKSGFNQGWGSRGIGKLPDTRKMNEHMFNEVQNAYKKIELYNECYTTLLKNRNFENTMLFVDPPYVEKSSGVYSFTNEEQTQLLSIIESWKGPVLYTNIFNEEHIKKLTSKWNYKILRDSMGMGKPGASSRNVKEAVYFNFKEM